MFLAAALAAALIAALALFFLDEGELLPAKMLAPEKGSGDGDKETTIGNNRDEECLADGRVLDGRERG